MIFDVDVGGIAVRFTRSCFTGKATVSASGLTEVVQSPWNPMTHVSFKLKRGWAWKINGRTLTIEKERPLLVPWARPATYRAFVDGALVLERSGY